LRRDDFAFKDDLTAYEFGPDGLATDIFLRKPEGH
jgi:hypothetical protein